MTTQQAIDDDTISYRRRLRKQTQIVSLANASTCDDKRSLFEWTKKRLIEKTALKNHCIKYKNSSNIT